MADLLTDLEGFLGKEAADKLRATPDAVTRLSRASEIMSFYDGYTETPPTAPRVREAPPTVRSATGAGDETLAQIMARLDGLGNIDEKIKEGVNKIVEARGAELRSGAVADSIRIVRDLTRLDARNRADFGEDMDDAKLQAHIDSATAIGRPFRTVTDAYEDMTRQARIDKQVAAGIESGVREKLKDRASGAVPGVTPTAASPMLTMLHKRPNGSTDSGTHLDKAARALEERLESRGEHVA